MDKREFDALYKRLRSKVEHEDDLVHQRLTWMIMLHGLLFTAYGFSLSAEATSLSAPGILTSSSAEQKAAYSDFTRTIHSLRTAMIFVGIVSSLAALFGVVAAFRAIREDAALLIPYRKKHHKSIYPELIGRSAVNMLGMVSGIAFPFLAGGVWTWIGGFIPNPIVLGIGVIIVAIIALAIWPFMSQSEMLSGEKEAEEGSTHKETRPHVKQMSIDKDKVTEREGSVQEKEKVVEEEHPEKSL